MKTLPNNKSRLVLALLCCIMNSAGAFAQTQRHVKHPSLGDGTIQGRLDALQEYYRYPPGSRAIDSSVPSTRMTMRDGRWLCGSSTTSLG